MSRHQELYSQTAGYDGCHRVVKYFMPSCAPECFPRDASSHSTPNHIPEVLFTAPSQRTVHRCDDIERRVPSGYFLDILYCLQRCRGKFMQIDKHRKLACPIISSISTRIESSITRFCQIQINGVLVMSLSSISIQIDMPTLQHNFNCWRRIALVHVHVIRSK